MIKSASRMSELRDCHPQVKVLAGKIIGRQQSQGGLTGGKGHGPPRAGAPADFAHEGGYRGVRPEGGASPNAGRGPGILAFRQKPPRHRTRASRWFPRRNGPDGGKYEVEHSVQRTSCLSFPSVPPLRGGRAAFPPRTRPLLKPLYSARTLCTPPRTIRKDLSAVTWKRRVNRPRLPWRSMGPGVDQGNGTRGRGAGGGRRR